MSQMYFKSNGYIKFKLHSHYDLIDKINYDLSEYWLNLEAPPCLPNFEAQQNLLNEGHLRMQDAWKCFDSIKELSVLPEIINILTQLYDLKPLPFQTLNFYAGTEQTVHSDSVHFNSEPFRQMCGVWIALEDISLEQGPLFYYPKSHTLPELNNDILGFELNTNNYHKIVHYWEKSLTEKKYTLNYALLKKGEGIIWDGNLLHGGTKHKDRNKTRQSMVTHFYIEGAKPWRPLSSTTNQRDYFEPDWIT